MKPRSIILALLIAAVLVGFIGGPIASPDSIPPTMAQLKAKIQRQANRIADLNDQIDAQDAVIATQNATITRLRARDPLDQILSRNPDGQWDAMVALWDAFPKLPVGDLCGYDKSSVPDEGIGLTVTSYTFYLITGC